jgi:methylated-DNA-[protein]-cysteine S-methyltransferase
MTPRHTPAPVLAPPVGGESTVVGYRTVGTSIGELLVAATPDGVVRLGLASEDHGAVVEQLSTTVGPVEPDANAGIVGDAVRQIEEYLAGRRHDFDLPLDLRLSRGFRRTVLDALVEVPYGTTVTYTELAAAAGNPRAVRAAASACATNPVPVIVPCHRVVRSDGSVGRYGGGSDVKVQLLALESA